MSAVRIGVRVDDFGRPIGSLLQDEGPGRARSTGHAVTGQPAFRGTLVIGDHGKEEKKRWHDNRPRPERNGCSGRTHLDCILPVGHDGECARVSCGAPMLDGTCARRPGHAGGLGGGHRSAAAVDRDRMRRR